MREITTAIGLLGAGLVGSIAFPDFTAQVLENAISSKTPTLPGLTRKSLKLFHKS